MYNKLKSVVEILNLKNRPKISVYKRKWKTPTILVWVTCVIYYLSTSHVEPNKGTCMPLSQGGRSHRQGLSCGLLPCWVLWQEETLALWAKGAPPVMPPTDWFNQVKSAMTIQVSVLGWVNGRIQNFLTFPNLNSMPFPSNFPLLHPSLLFHCLSANLAAEFSYKASSRSKMREVVVLLWLAHFTEHHVLKGHPRCCRYQSSVPFKAG